MSQGTEGLPPVFLGVLIGGLGSAVLFSIILLRLRRAGRGDREAASRLLLGGEVLRSKEGGARCRASTGFCGARMRTLRRVFRTPGLVIGLVITASFAVASIAAPLIAPPGEGDPYLIPTGSFERLPQPPGPGHPLGTMPRQRDILYGLVWGARVAIKVGLSITLGRAVLGVLLGLVSGYSGGVLDAVIMRFTDAFLAFPIMAAALIVLTFFGGGLVGSVGGGAERGIVLALILFGWMQYARLIRGNVLVQREKEYVQAATCVGARKSRITLRHVLPNASQGLFVLVASDIGAMVVLAAVFSFMGLSGGEALADWGQMLNLSRNWIIGTPNNAFRYWYTYIPPILAIVLFSVGWNLIGDGLRDVLDPRLR